MKKERIIYFGLLAIVFLVSTLFFSYAFFTSKNEQHGKLNIVAGTLNYKIESNDLEKNKITVKANEIKKITINLMSLNEIDSKYELYYTLSNTNSNLRIGYDINTKDSVLGTIGANSKKEITIVLRNEGSTESIVEFSTIGGLKNNDLVLKEGNSLNQVVGKYTSYNIGEEITLIDGSKWHVLENSDETNPNVVLLSDYNLNSDGTYNDECGRDINSTYICSSMAFDSDNTNIYDETDNNNIGYFISKTYAPKVMEVLPGTNNVTLPTAEQIAQANGKIFNQVDLTLTSSWLLTTNYWTRTSDVTNDYYVWYVSGEHNGIYGYNTNTNTHYGVRPAITTLKSNIVETMSSTTELTIGKSVEAIDGSKWHVLENSGSDSKYVTLLSDYNLNSDGSYNTECGSNINSTNYCSPMVFDVDNTQVYDETDNNNIGYFIKNTYTLKVEKELSETTNVTLPTAEQIAKADGKTFSQLGLSISNLWLLTTDYWTRTAYVSNASDVWNVSGTTSYLYFDSATYSNVYGARPAITTLKSNLLAK